MTDFGNLGDLLGRLGIRNGHGKLVDVDGRPFGLAVHLKIAVICADGFLSKGVSELLDCLLYVSLGGGRVW